MTLPQHSSQSEKVLIRVVSIGSYQLESEARRKTNNASFKFGFQANKNWEKFLIKTIFYDFSDKF